MSWSEERIAQLRKMWGEGATCTEIAATLACGLTRNAVIGKVHRLGLSGRKKVNPPKPAPRLPSFRVPSLATSPGVRVGGPGKQAPHSVGAKRDSLLGPSPARAEPSAGSGEVGTVEVGADLFAPTAPKIREKDIAIPPTQRVTIMELRETTCRWPMGDPLTPEFRFCGGHAPIGDGPYCNAHRQIAYEHAPRRQWTPQEREKRIRADRDRARRSAVEDRSPFEGWA